MYQERAHPRRPDKRSAPGFNSSERSITTSSPDQHRLDLSSDLGPAGPDRLPACRLSLSECSAVLYQDPCLGHILLAGAGCHYIRPAFRCGGGAILNSCRTKLTVNHRPSLKGICERRLHSIRSLSTSALFLNLRRCG